MRSINVVLSAIALAAFAGCSHEHMSSNTPSDEACRANMSDDVANAARVSGEGVQAGAETAVAGVKQAGRATGGLVTGGTSGARDEWNKGKAETKQKAREGREDVADANLPRCTRP